MSRDFIRGQIPDVPDHRDFMYGAVRKPLAAPYLQSVDLRQWCSPIEDQGDLGSCHDKETEVLTFDGQKLFSEISLDDLLATVNPDNQELLFENPTNIIKYHYSGEMVCANNQSINFKVTPNHKMLVRKQNESERTLDASYVLVEACDIGQYSGLMNRVKYIGDNPDEYILSGVSHKLKEQRNDLHIPLKTWLQFIGIYLAEGTMLKETQQKDRVSYKIQIAGSKEREKEFIRSVLNDMNIKYLELDDRFTFQNKRIYKNMEMLGLKGVHAPDKFVPRFIFELSSNLISEFLLGHFMGDGCNGNGVKTHYTSSYQLANDLQQLIFMSGNETKLYIRNTRNSIIDDRTVNGNYPEYFVTICEKKNLSIERSKQIYKEEYSGYVYCAEVPSYHTLVTRRNGKILISGNCTAQALTSAMEYLLNKNKKQLYHFSRLFLYYNERVMEGSVGYDSGAMIRDGIKCMAKYGVCTEALQPYDISKFKRKPAARCYSDALKHQILSYYRITNLDEMIHCLSDGFPFVVGIAVYDSFMTQSVANTGVVNLPTKKDEFLGGHAVMAVGYDQSTRRFIMRNSWGTEWGMQGYFTIPFEYLGNGNLADDIWTVRIMEI